MCHLFFCSLCLYLRLPVLVSLVFTDVLALSCAKYFEALLMYMFTGS